MLQPTEVCYIALFICYLSGAHILRLAHLSFFTEVRHAVAAAFIAFYISGRNVKCFWSCSISRRREMVIRFVLCTLAHTVVLGKAFIGGKNISFGGQDLAHLRTPISLPIM